MHTIEKEFFNGLWQVGKKLTGEGFENPCFGGKRPGKPGYEDATAGLFYFGPNSAF